MQTPKEVFLHLSEEYAKCTHLSDCTGYISRFICISLLNMSEGMISKMLCSECTLIVEENMPKKGHWATRSPDWKGRDTWWETADAEDIKQVFQDKSKFLKELADGILTQENG